MIIRLIVLIFALNAFAPAAMAIPCEMMNHGDMSSMSHAGHDMSSHQMSEKSMNHDEKHCHNDENHSCGSIDCITACAVNAPLLIVENLKTFPNKAISQYPQEYLETLYKIILAINTPPPLV